MCHKAGRIVPATVVDHKDPHRGDPRIFWDKSRWQSLCANHHNSDKQRIEKGGTPIRQVGLDGYPVGE